MFADVVTRRLRVLRICVDVLRDVTVPEGGHDGVTSVYNSSARDRHGVNQSDLAHLLAGSRINAAWISS